MKPHSRPRLVTLLHFRFALSLLLAVAICTGCTSSRSSSRTISLSSTAQTIVSDLRKCLDCSNPHFIALHLEQKCGDLDHLFAAFRRKFWKFDSVMIGPDQTGLIATIDSGSGVGNDLFFVYLKQGNKLVPLADFQCAGFSILTDRVNSGLYDLYTQSHMSAHGGPFRYHRWTGHKYVVYQSGDTRERP
jgi:hypothetical protein